VRRVAGRIRAEDVAAVREAVRIEEVVGDHLTLRRTGPDSLTGLCPFHEERTASFTVTPSKNLWYCFGCAEGGDVFDFQQRIDHATFAEAVERLAQRVGVNVRYERGGAVSGAEQGRRTRLAHAVTLAAAFYRRQLDEAPAAPARDFLHSRGFPAETWARFGLGYAPRGWDSLLRHLRNQGIPDEEALTAGLLASGNRGPYDRFRGRLVWPIRQPDGQVIGFGARRLDPEDTGPKYLNTPETPLYQKGRVLYGLDLARVAIARERRVVLVEGYTDVMACQLAGVATAVATCGTAFGADHARVVRRLLTDDERLMGEVIFTFDGDAAGRRAAVRAFELDQVFAASTFVAVQPDGLDPCDLRLRSGDEAVRGLIAGRVPLVEYVIRSGLSEFDLATAEGRVAALRASVPLIARIRDLALRPEYARLLAGWLGTPESQVNGALAAEVRSRSQADSRSDAQPGSEPGVTRTAGRGTGPAATLVPTARGAADDEPDRAGRLLEREALRLAVQQPGITHDLLTATAEAAFTVATARTAAAHLRTSPRPLPGAEAGWLEALLAAAPDDGQRRLLRALAAEQLLREADERYAEQVFARLAERHLDRRIAELRGLVQRQSTGAAVTEAGAPTGEELFAELMACEAQRRLLRERSTAT